MTQDLTPVPPYLRWLVLEAAIVRWLMISVKKVETIIKIYILRFLL